MGKFAKVTLIALALLLLRVEVSGAQQASEFTIKEAGPSFSESDRALIHDYYKRIHSATAPGSLDRSNLPIEIEKILVPGGRVPLHYEKKLQAIPEPLKRRLSLITGNYAYYKLGKHVLLVHKATLDIADAVRNAGWE
jgi:hypothetical protein